MQSKIKFRGYWRFECRRRGRLIWEEKLDENLVVDAGLAEVFVNGLTSKTWYIGLTGGTPSISAADTMSSKSWTDFTGVDEAAREEWVEVVTGASATNAASVAEYTITSGSQTIGGGFLTDSPTKGGTTGILFSVKAFTGGDRTGNQAGDKIQITFVSDATDDGV